MYVEIGDDGLLPRGDVHDVDGVAEVGPFARRDGTAGRPPERAYPRCGERTILPPRSMQNSEATQS
jgi:hypothetical protein